MGQQKIKPFLCYVALILRKAASSLFLKHKSPFAGCGVWRVAEAEGAGLRGPQLGGRAPTGPGGEGSSSHPPHWPGVGITEWELFQE